MFETIFVMVFSVITSNHAYIGVANHSKWDRPEVTLENPIGTVRSTWDLNPDWQVYYKHESGLMDWEEGVGYNTVGIELKLK